MHRYNSQALVLLKKHNKWDTFDFQTCLAYYVYLSTMHRICIDSDAAFIVSYHSL